MDIETRSLDTGDAIDQTDQDVHQYPVCSSFFDLGRPIQQTGFGNMETQHQTAYHGLHFGYHEAYTTDVSAFRTPAQFAEAHHQFEQFQQSRHHYNTVGLPPSPGLDSGSPDAMFQFEDQLALESSAMRIQGHPVPDMYWPTEELGTLEDGTGLEQLSDSGNIDPKDGGDGIVTHKMARADPAAATGAETADGSIPLICTACPKKQRFSDISHLLTHINSKGHLHAHQLLKIRALNDQAASNNLQEYAQWYDEHGIEKLLADRLAQRDQKEAAGRKRKARNESASTPKATYGTKSIKLENDDSTRSLPSKTSVFRMDRREYVSNSNTRTPSLHRNSSFNFVESPSGYVMSPLSPASNGNDVVASSVEGHDEHPRMKGRYYPGMNVFDAATDDMRRMRNQRKDKSAVDRMRAFSMAVTSDEHVYNLDFDLERIRDVFATPSIESTPTPKPELKKVGVKASVLGAFEEEDDEDTQDVKGRRVTHGRGSNGLRGPLGLINDGNGFDHLNFGLDQAASSEPKIETAGFQLRQRHPLQSLSTNTSLAQANSTTKHYHSRFGESGKENMHSGLRFSQASDNGHLFSPGVNDRITGAASFSSNPLCFQPGNLHFNPFAGSMTSGYRPDATVPHNSFQPINGVSHQAMLSHYLSSQGGRESLAGQPEDDSFYEGSV